MSLSYCFTSFFFELFLQQAGLCRLFFSPLWRSIFDESFIDLDDFFPAANVEHVA